MGWLIAVRRSDNVYGWLLLASADCLGLSILGVGLMARNGADQGLVSILGASLTSLSTVFYGLTWVFVPLLFPDGRLPSRGWRVGVWIAVTSIAAHWLGVLLFPDEIWAGAPSGGNPLGLDGTAGLLAAAVGGTGQVVTYLVGLSVLVSLIRRWWRSTSIERRLRWMVAGSGVTLVGFALTLLMAGESQAASWVGVMVAMATLPAVIVVAVFRHNLLDVRVGIRGSRFFLIFDLRPTVDELLTELGPGLEEAEPVEQLGRLAGAVRAGLETRWAAVTLADGTRVVAGREEGEAVLTVPAGLGHIECGPKVAGRLTSEDRRLLAALAVPIGLAIQNAGLVARLVNAQEAERRGSSATSTTGRSSSSSR
ncbi:hypothetical protein ACFQX6_56530 [Streptosporangium lutulentum]